MQWPNDWRLRDCLCVCGGISLLQVILVFLSQVGIDVPVIRQITGFVFITFIPGILLLRILKIHNINIVESIVYSVGLSLSLIMLGLALADVTLPLVGIRQPLAPVATILTLAALYTVLMALAWLQERRAELPNITKTRPALSLNSVLFMVLILALVVVGVKVSDLTGNNLIIIASLLLIAAAVGLAAYRRFIQPAAYAFALFIISLGLLYQTTLMSPFMVGTDVYAEYQVYRTAASAGVWLYTLPSTINSCLSIVILAPVYAGMLGISGIWVFKAVYPILFSFLPLALYRIFRIQTGQFRAFLAAFFFMAVPTFSLELTSLARQQVAELFMGLTILLLVDRKITNGPKLAMLLLFSSGIIVSHYSLGFINLIYMGLLLVFIVMMKRGFFPRLWALLTRKTGGLPDYINRPGSGSLPLRLIILTVAFYFVFAFAWYGFTSSGINLSFLTYEWSRQTGSVNQMVGGAITQPSGNIPPSSSAAPSDSLIKTALGFDFWQVSWQGKIFRLLQYLTQLFLVAGCFRLLLRPKGLKFSLEYIALSVISILLLIACILLPYLATVFNTSRWYHVLLITLAPFAVLGGEAIVLSLKYLWQRARASWPVVSWEIVSPKVLASIAIVIFVPYFIFTSGIIYEVTGQQVTDRVDAPYSFALSNNRLNLTGIFNEQDEAAAEWLCSKSGGTTLNIYADANSYKMLLMPGCSVNWIYIPIRENLPSASYLYLTSWNNEKNSIAFSQSGKPGLRSFYNLTDVPATIQATNYGDKIYSNGGPAILILTK
jgi:uncharacterized membrane protein